ncbi:MAG TPA: sugar ABC transporter permease [Acetobacteraceae bacterium]|nr:sugar ABC transporter permease [Acetobacteraceae bacterium]
MWRHRSLYLFLLPFAALTAVFGIWPIGEGIRVAFLDSSTALGNAPAYVGFANFATVLSDPAFVSSLWRTLLFTFVSVALNVTLALVLALMLANPLLDRGRTWFKLAIFLPTITPDVASFIVWKWMFNQDFGAVNHALDALGLPPFPGITTTGGAFATLVIVELWHHVGLYTLIFLTNFQLLDRSLDEAAQIDGANRWQRLLRVKLPQLKPAITVNTVYALIEFLKTFTVVFVITKGGPNFSTNYLSYYAYSRFNTGAYGEAAAMATVLFAVVFGMAVTAYWAMEREAA